jgi:integrase
VTARSRREFGSKESSSPTAALFATIGLGREGSVEFYQALADVVTRAPSQGTVKSLIWRYKQSPEHATLRPRTRADYAKQLDKIESVFGPLTLQAMASREISRHIYDFRDGLKASPRRADYAIQVLKLLLAWATRRGLIERNRAALVERLYHSDRRERVWSDDQISSFLETAPEPLRWAMMLALETGQRQGDLITLTWSAIGNGTISLRQSKTGARVCVPISAALEKTLEDARVVGSPVILTKASGRPWDPKGNGFRAAWQAACKAAGVRGVTFHDLRGTFVTRRLAVGWTTLEVAMCTGHSLRDLASLDTYADREAIASATAQRVVLREAGIKA